DTAGLEKARARLGALEDAVRRNTAQPINDANFEKFFGYPGTAKRNLPLQ
ncbi:acyl-CoA synthetase, partial [Mycobacterium manitobense]|nr:acyl-CoA synthetase [[Mycobacterium] manitobense]